jgi:dolichol-phosphate mannosyltransferase
VAKLAGLDFSQMISRGYSFHEEFLWRVARHGCRVAETPITFVDRVKGNSKINAHEAWTAVRVIFKLGIQERFGNRTSPPSLNRDNRG